MLNLDSLKRIETIIIEQSQQVLLPYLNHTTAAIKSDGSIVTDADLAMQEAIKTEIAKAFGNHIPCLGEECSAEEQDQIVSNESEFWILDPVDGTSNFHATFPVFCTTIAYVCDGKIQMGVTYDPIRKECFSALRNEGFYYNQNKINPSDYASADVLKDCIAFVDFKRLKASQRTQLVSNPPFKSQRNIGSSALEWAWLAMNRTQLTYHGGQKLWDYAAGSLFIEEIGGQSCDQYGLDLYQGNCSERSIIASSSKALFKFWKQEIDALN